MAIQALDLVTDGDPGARADLLLALARAEDRGGNDEACRTAPLEAAELATRIGDPFRLGSAAVEYAGSFWYTAASAQDPRRLQLYAAAEAALRAADGGPDRDSLLATVLSRHAAAFSFRDPAEHARVVAARSRVLAQLVITHIRYIIHDIDFVCSIKTRRPILWRWAPLRCFGLGRGEACSGPIAGSGRVGEFGECVADNALPLATYPAGSWGPAEVDALMHGENVWRVP